jgi:hypothetical protein
MEPQNIKNNPQITQMGADFNLTEFRNIRMEMSHGKK